MSRLRILRFFVVALSLIVLAGACGREGPGLRIGVKDFDEQRILGEMSAALLQDAGIPVERVVMCGDTYACQEALINGDLDLMVEYTGTGWLTRGRLAGDGRVDVETLDALYRPLGLRWMHPLGFDNSYALAVRTDRAAADWIQRIEDLADVPDGLRVACPEEYLRRPLDGLPALLRRFGLRLAAEPRIIPDPAARIQALLGGQVDVAILYGTDGAFLDSRIRVLEDPSEFFPPYEAAFLVRQGVLEQRRRVEETLSKLAGRVDEDTMHQLNFAVSMEGRDPQAVARDFLQSEGLLAADTTRPVRAPGLLLGVHQSDRLTAFTAQAIAALGKVYPERSIHLQASDDPVERLAEGRIRFMVTGAERFFQHGHDGTQREERMEALAVLGSRTLHFLVRTDLEGPIQNLALAPPESGAGRVGRLVSGLMGVPVELTGEADAVILALSAGTVDAALIFSELGAAPLMEALDVGGVRIESIPADLADRITLRAPYLRAGRIPAGTYPDQRGPLDTLSAQVLLCGPSRSLSVPQGAGPALALPTVGRPVSMDRVQRIGRALGVSESPDPVVPSYWSLGRSVRMQTDSTPEVLDRLLNVFVLGFLAWLAWLLFRRDPEV